MDITIKRLRVGSDLTMRATLTDGGVRVSWQSVDNICAYMYSDAQRVMAGEAQASVDPEDPFTLVVRYTVDEPQYLGINRLVVTCSYMGQTKTYDMPVVEFVELLQEQGTSTVETVAVAFEVSDVTSSILDEVIAAAIAATRDAREAEADIVAAEALREAAETERQQNETERQQAEAERQEGYTEMTRKVGQMEQDVEDFGERLGDVEIVIPSAASEDNKLVDKETLDESIAFNTAHYISNNGNPFASVEELEAYPKERLTNNDYAVVVGVDEDEHTTYTYYVYNSATQSWAKEFVIDTLLTPFTDAQMAALNSGITAAILQSMQSQMEEMQRDIDGKQEQLVSGENIKTVNGQSLLGSGNIEIQGGAGDITDMNALASMVVATPTQQSFIERATPAGGIAYIPRVYGNSVKSRNLWNEEWELGAVSVAGWLINDPARIRPKNPIKVDPNTTYTFACQGYEDARKYIIFYEHAEDEASMSFVALESREISTFTTPNGCHYVRFSWETSANYGNTYKHDIAILPQGFTQYEPYFEGIRNLTATGIESRNAAGAVVASLPLNISDIVRADGTQLFPDGLLSAGSARDLIDRVNGRATKPVKAVDLGSLEWGYNVANAVLWANVPDRKHLYVSYANGICSRYTVIPDNLSPSLPEGSLVFTFLNAPTNIAVKDTSFGSDVAAFKTAMHGVMLYYEAAEPETVTFSPMKAFYKTEQGGTERLTGEDSAPIVADMGYKA